MLFSFVDEVVKEVAKPDLLDRITNIVTAICVAVTLLVTVANRVMNWLDKWELKKAITANTDLTEKKAEEVKKSVNVAAQGVTDAADKLDSATKTSQVEVARVAAYAAKEAASKVAEVAAAQAKEVAVGVAAEATKAALAVADNIEEMKGTLNGALARKIDMARSEGYSAGVLDGTAIKETVVNNTLRITKLEQGQQQIREDIKAVLDAVQSK